MHFQPSLNDQALPNIIRSALVIGTHKAWKNSTGSLDAEARQNPFAVNHHRDRYALEIAMESVRRYERKTHRLPDVLKIDIPTYRLFAFAGMLANVHARLSLRGQKALAGRVRGGLTDDTGLAPLAFELLMASHLMQKGVDVEWHDLEEGGGFDLLARRGTAVAEVECKTFSADIGRKVHQRRHYQLGGLIHKDMSAALERHGSFFLDVIIEDRLAGRAIDEVANTVRAALQSGSDIPESAPCSIVMHRLSPEEIPFDPNSEHVSESDVASFIERRFNQLNQSLLLLSKPGRRVGIVATRSAKPDDVVDGMYRQLKKGLTQFTGSRPAILCAHLLDLNPSQILALHAAQEKGEPSGLNRIATRLFKHSPTLLHTIRFTAPGDLQESQTIFGSTRRRHLMETGLSYDFASHHHPLASDKAYRLLS